MSASILDPRMIDPSKPLTITSTILTNVTASDIVTSSGTSNDWNAASSLVQTNSAFWEESADITNLQTFIQSNSASWEESADISNLETFVQTNSSKSVINQLWAGEARCWPMGHAFNSSTVQRIHCPAGVTFARIGFVSGSFISHVNGDYSEDAIRIQRTYQDTSAASATIVFNLTQEESKPLCGKNVVLQWNGSKGLEYSGSDIEYRLQWSEEPQQPILNDDGTYTNGNQVTLSGTFVFDLSAQPIQTPYWGTGYIPSDATQVSVCFTIPFAGTAGLEDYVDFENIALYEGNSLKNVLIESYATIVNKASTRYQSSYPYGFPRGSTTRQGAAQAVAAASLNTYAFTIPVRFSPPMAVVPQFFFQNTVTGTESRLWNVTTNTFVNGLAYNLSESGVTITNFQIGGVSAGDQLLCQWTANVIF